jgi:glyoxalase family protein
MRLEGVHHITAITGDAPRNVDFYTGRLGLRLVAKTVNQDDPTVYHLFYADERGRPGSELTFFEYPGAKPGRAGAGMVHTIVSRVASEEALDFWAARLGVARDGDRVRFEDPEGLAHELVVDATGDAPLVAEHPEIPAEMALRGFDSVRAFSDVPARSGALIEKLLAGTRVGEDEWELRGSMRGGTIAYDPAPAERGRQSGGSVHHVAWGSTVDDYEAWNERLVGAGVATSGLVDRHYFRSIYFREPSGVLFEIADYGPGFTVDGLSYDELGSRIILPPRFEAHREQIERTLTPLPDPRADWVSGPSR